MYSKAVLKIYPMNKILSICLICIYSLLSNLAIANEDFALNEVFSDDEIESQIKSLSSQVDLRYNNEVKKIINTYLTTGKEGTQKIIGRSHYYFPIIEDIMITSQHYIPEEIKYLAVVESSLNPVIRSKAGAVGLWQFMRSTARMYGLSVSSHYDERKDVTKSTTAAVKFLSDLYNEFGDWTLAMAAYNCGPGNVRKAIRRGKSADYWKIRKYLPKETRRYLPKFVAFSYVMSYMDQIGIEQDAPFSEHNSFASTVIYNKTKLKDISALCGLKVKEILKYNPSYHSRIIPARKNGNVLILPESHMLQYLSNQNKLHEIENVFYLKNTLISIPAPIEKVVENNLNIVEKVEKPEARPLVATSSIEGIEDLNIDYNTQVKAKKTQKVQVIPTYKKIKLKKRQTLRNLFGNDKKDIVSINEKIQTTGTIVVRD